MITISNVYNLYPWSPALRLARNMLQDIQVHTIGRLFISPPEAQLMAVNLAYFEQVFRPHAFPAHNVREGLHTHYYLHNDHS